MLKVGVFQLIEGRKEQSICEWNLKLRKSLWDEISKLLLLSHVGLPREKYSLFLKSMFDGHYLQDDIIYFHVMKNFSCLFLRMKPQSNQNRGCDVNILTDTHTQKERWDIFLQSQIQQFLLSNISEWFEVPVIMFHFTVMFSEIFTWHQNSKIP